MTIPSLPMARMCATGFGPMKSLTSYCHGHDINWAADMRIALLERPVQGVTASVCIIKEEQFHNFKYDNKDLCVGERMA